MGWLRWCCVLNRVNEFISDAMAAAVAVAAVVLLSAVTEFRESVAGTQQLSGVFAVLTLGWQLLAQQASHSNGVDATRGSYIVVVGHLGCLLGDDAY